MTSVWDDPDLKFVDEFVKLENVGDGFTGQITNIRSHRFEDGSVAAQITFVDRSDGVERTWSAGQVQAKRKLAEVRPEIGWWIKVALTSIEKRGNKTLKHIDLDARPGDTAPAASAPPASAPPASPPALASTFTAPAGTNPAATTWPACPSGVDTATWGAMNASQRAQMYTALGLPVPGAPAGGAAFTDEPPF